MRNRSSFWDKFINYFIAPVDNTVATPVNNFEFMDDLKNHLAYPGPNASDPYPNINDTPNAASMKGGIATLGVVSVIGAVTIKFYQRLRKKEMHSHYFFYERLSAIKAWLKVRPESKCSPEILFAAAYYYNPDLSPLVLWFRRWASLARSSDYLELKKYLQDQSTTGKKTQDSLKELFQQINENFALYISEKKEYGHWIAEEKDGKWIVRRKASPASIAGSNESNPLRSKTKKNKTLGQKVWNFIDERINELGLASFAYWIGVFIFYLFAGVGVIGGAVVFPPIIIAGVVLAGVWITKVIQHQKESALNFHHLIHEDDDTRLLEEIKNHLLIESLSQKKVNFKSSRLCNDIEKTLQKRQRMIFVGCIFNGFIGGCFKISFSSWLIFAALGLVVTFNPLGLAIVAGGTLVLGIAYGIYSAWRNFKSQVSLHEGNVSQLNTLKKDNFEIPDISLREYDRLFRRGKPDNSFGSTTKQFLKRAWIGLTRVGTGILLLKLTGFGVATAILGALGITAGIAALPLIGILAAGGLIFAGYYIYQYHLESQERQLDQVMNSLSYPLLSEYKIAAANENVYPSETSSEQQQKDKTVFRFTATSAKTRVRQNAKLSFGASKPEYLPKSIPPPFFNHTRKRKTPSDPNPEHKNKKMRIQPTSR